MWSLDLAEALKGVVRRLGEPNPRPKATSRRQPCRLLRAQGGARPPRRWPRPRGRRPPSPSALSVSSPGLTSEGKKGNSEGFLESAPRGLSVLGRSERGREGPRKAEKKAEAGQRARSTFEAVSNPSQGGWGGSESPAGGRQSRVLKNVLNSCGNQQDCKSPPPPQHTSFPAPCPPSPDLHTWGPQPFVLR